MGEYLCLIRPARAGFAEQTTPQELETMSKHGAYATDLFNQGVMLIFGPCLDRSLGMSVLQAGSLEEARQIANSDPAVAEGLMQPELYEMCISLMQRDYVTQTKQEAKG